MPKRPRQWCHPSPLNRVQKLHSGKPRVNWSTQCSVGQWRAHDLGKRRCPNNTTTTSSSTDKASSKWNVIWTWLHTHLLTHSLTHTHSVALSPRGNWRKWSGNWEGEKGKESEEKEGHSKVSAIGQLQLGHSIYFTVNQYPRYYEPVCVCVTKRGTLFNSFRKWIEEGEKKKAFSLPLEVSKGPRSSADACAVPEQTALSAKLCGLCSAAKEMVTTSTTTTVTITTITIISITSNSSSISSFTESTFALDLFAFCLSNCLGCVDYETIR